MFHFSSFYTSQKYGTYLQKTLLFEQKCVLFAQSTNKINFSQNDLNDIMQIGISKTDINLHLFLISLLKSTIQWHF